MPGGGVCLPNFFPQIQAQSFALPIPDHTDTRFLPLGLLPHFRYIAISVYQMRNSSLICLLVVVQCMPQWSICYVFRFCFCNLISWWTFAFVLINTYFFTKCTC